MNENTISLKPAFNFSFNHRIIKNGVSVGCFDGEINSSGELISRGRQQIVLVTETNKIILQNSETIFHVPETVNCLAVCEILSKNLFSTDMVLIGTKNSLTAFDVFNNKTLFYREIPEGVNCIKIGTLDENNEKIIICGCGTTIWGLKVDGTDLFWTALGDEINTLELCDIDNDGLNELLVGSNGVEIKVFKNASFLSEFDEGDPTIALCSLGAAMFAFGLLSGVVGVYGNGERLWRVKTKLRIIALLPFPNSNQVSCIWHNGKIDIRDINSGEIYCKENVESNNILVSAFLSYLNCTTNKTQQLTMVYHNGQVFGFDFSNKNTDSNNLESLMREYSQRKHNLLEELKNLKLHKESLKNSTSNHSMVPLNTNLDCKLCLSIDQGLCLQLTVSNNVPIKAVLLFAEGIFDSECYSIHPNTEESPHLNAYFFPKIDINTELFIKVIAGFINENQLYVFEVNQILPKFATFYQLNSLTKFDKEPESCVEFNLTTRLDNLSVWLVENFLECNNIDNNLNNENNNVILLKFICTRNNEPLIIELKSSGVSVLRHNNIESTANILQSLCAYLNIKELNCRANFPELLASVSSTITSMVEKYEVIERLSSDWAERLNTVRECVVRAEDALITNNIALARKFYVRVSMYNSELIAQHNIRLNARKELLNSLKLLNLSIEQFSRLRIGSAASKLIYECRKAIEEENMSILPKLFQFGV